MDGQSQRRNLIAQLFASVEKLVEVLPQYWHADKSKYETRLGGLSIPAGVDIA
jgi:hypothetical protein